MKTVCFNIISLSRKKLQLKRCPSCYNALTTREVDQSQASQAFYETATTPVIITSLAECPKCGWWAIREQRLDDASYSPLTEDLIITDASIKEDVRADESPSQKHSVTWKAVLADKTYWANEETISSRDAVQLFGPTEMLMPKIAIPSREVLLEKLKSLAVILFPILIFILIAIYS